MTTFPSQTTLWAGLHRRAALDADRLALTFADITWTFGTFDVAVERMAAVLHARGVAPGMRVGFLSFNRPECLFTLFACARLGAIFVPVNFRLSAAELVVLLTDADVHALVVGPEHADVVDRLKGDIACRHFLVIGAQAVPGWTSLQEALDSAGPEAPVCEVGATDVATLVYTSGTTGVPKGAMLTHGNLWANDINWMLSYAITANDTLLTSAPMFHVGGIFVLLSTVMLVGGHVILHQAFEAGDVLEAIRKHRVTLTFSVPTMLQMLTRHPAFNDTDLSSLRLVVVGGAPSPESLLRECARRDIPVSHTYGMTECTTACTFLETASATRKLNSAGRPLPLSEVRLSDENGAAIHAPQQRGEICTRGATVMAGYWGRPDATAAASTPDGWFRTGDIGYFDEEGYLFVCDRLKDMIISGGENIYPAEVESALLEHPDIAQAAVIARPDERWGERPCAVVVLKPGTTLTLEELQAFCHDRLARYKIPKELHRVEQLPLSGAGKVLKQMLRATIAEASAHSGADFQKPGRRLT